MFDNIKIAINNSDMAQSFFQPMHTRPHNDTHDPSTREDTIEMDTHHEQLEDTHSTGEHVALADATTSYRETHTGTQSNPLSTTKAHVTNTVTADSKRSLLLDELDEPIQPLQHIGTLIKAITSQSEALHAYDEAMRGAGNPFEGAINSVSDESIDKFVFIKKDESLVDMLHGATLASGAIRSLSELAAKVNVGEIEERLLASIAECEDLVEQIGFSELLVRQRKRLYEEGKIARAEEIQARFKDDPLLPKALAVAAGVDRTLPPHVANSPNMGQKPIYYSEKACHPALCLAHLDKIEASKRGFLLRRDFALQQIKGPIHTSPCLIAEKPAAASIPLEQVMEMPPSKLSRYCMDGTISETNDKRMLPAVVEAATGIECDQLPDLCKQVLNARKIWPDRELYSIVDDTDAAYCRCVASEQTTRFTAIDVIVGGVQCILFLSTLWFGFIESGFWLEVIKKCLLTRAHDRSRAFILADNTANKEAYDLSISGQYVDDYYATGSYEYCLMERDAYREDVGDKKPGALGYTAISDAKAQFAQQVTRLGYAFDLKRLRVEMLEKTFAKLLLLVFVEVPLSTRSRDKVRVKLVQKLMSLSFRFASIIPYHKFIYGPICRMLEKIASNSKYNNNTYWSHSGITSLGLIRRALWWACKVVNLRSVPVWVPPHVGRLRIESKEQREERLIRSANFLLEVDATGAPLQLLGGIMMHPTSAFCCAVHLDGFGIYTDEGVYSKPFHINVLELAAAVVTVCGLVAYSASAGVPLRGARVHILTDNSSSQSWTDYCMTDTAATRFLLSILFYIQIAHGFVLTSGRISTTENVRADSLSRDFREAWMKAVKHELKDVPRLIIPRLYKELFRDASMTFSQTGTCTERLSTTIASGCELWSFGEA